MKDQIPTPFGPLPRYNHGMIGRELRFKPRRSGGADLRSSIFAGRMRPGMTATIRVRVRPRARWDQWRLVASPLVDFQRELGPAQGGPPPWTDRFTMDKFRMISARISTLGDPGSGSPYPPAVPSEEEIQ